MICCSVFSQHTTHLSVPNLTTPPTNNANYQGSKLRINIPLIIYFYISITHLSTYISINNLTFVIRSPGFVKKCVQS